MRFDGGIWLGREPKYGLENTTPPSGWSLAAHFSALYYDQFVGNNLTLEHTNGQDQLLPLAVINPWRYTGNLEYLAELKQAGFKAFGFFSHYQNWKFDSAAFKQLARDLPQVGLPIQVGVASLAELNAAGELFGPSGVPVLLRWLRGGGYTAIADEIALGRKFPNLYFDVANLVSLGTIKYLAESLGADRLYVASNAPLVYRSSVELLVNHANLTPADYKLIRGGTLSQIFNVVLKSSEPEPLTISELPKIDIHWHSEGWDLIEPGANLKSLKQKIAECNYQAVVTSSILSLNFDLAKGNENTLKIVEENPKIFGYVVIDPTRSADSLGEISKYQNHPKFLGIKTIQDYYNLGLDDERYDKVLAAAENLSWPVLAHKAGLAKAALKFPRLKFIAAHVSYANFAEFKNLPNVFFDLCGSYAHVGETNITALVQAVGSERILFGSDGPLISPWWGIGKLIDSKLSTKDLANIYYDNAKKLFPRLASTL